MSTQSATTSRLSPNLYSISLAAGFIIYTATVVRLAQRLTVGYEPGATQTVTPEASVWLVGILIAESLAIIGLYLLAQRAPEWLRRLLKQAMKAGIYLGTVALPLYLLPLRHAVAVLAVAHLTMAGYWALEKLNVDYLLHNLIALGLGVLVSGIAAVVITPAAAAAILVLLIMWDRVAVTQKDWMRNLMKATSGNGIPNYLVIPKQVRVPMDDVAEFLRGDSERPDALKSIIGLGDFVVPTLLPASAIIAAGTTTTPAVGAVAGIAIAAIVLVNDLEAGSAEALPALVWLNTGSLAGYAVAALPGVVA